MTSSLRRKRPTTARAAITLARTAASLLGLSLVLSAGGAFAQQPAGKTLSFHKEPKVLTFSRDTVPSTFVPATPVPVTYPGFQRTALLQDKKGADGKGVDLGETPAGEYNVQLEPPGPH